MTIAHSIVVGYDGSASARRAVERAAALSGYGTRLTIVTLAATPDAAGFAAEAEEFVRSRRLFAGVLRRDGDPADELLAAGRELRADLLVIGDGSAGSAGSDLVRRAACDVLVVR